MRDITNKEASSIELRLEKLTDRLTTASLNNDIDTVKEVMADINEIMEEFEFMNEGK